MDHKRYLEDEINYIYDYCKKTGFDKYITAEYRNYFESLIIEYGFMDMQQAIRKIHKWKMRYPINTLKETLYQMNVDVESLKEIPAYIAVQKERLEEIYQKQLQEHHEKMMIGKDVAFREMEVRQRLGKSYDGYWTFEEIENALLGWDEIEEDKIKIAKKLEEENILLSNV